MHAVFLKRPSTPVKHQWKVSGQPNLRSWVPIRSYRFTPRKTHYETLGLDRNCTTREIRTAFVKLSKEVHPDRNPSDESCHAKFVRLNEAYTVLVKPEARWHYDRSLNSDTGYQNVAETSYSKAWHDHNRQKFYEHTGFWDPDKKPSNEGPYYGIKGLQKVPNSFVVIGCVIFILVGITMHYLAIRYTNRVTQEAQDRKDKLYSKLYNESKERALQLATRDSQIEMMERRMKSSTTENPET